MSERDDLFSRLQSLIATAVHKNTPTEEARTAAVLALRLAVENGFIHKTMPVAADPAPPRPHAATPPVARPPVARGAQPATPRVSLRDKLRAAGAAVTSAPPHTTVRVTTHSPPRPSIFRQPQPQPHRWDHDDDGPPNIIRAKYAGYCLTCREDVEEGDTVRWIKGEGVIHEDCDLPF